MKEVYMNKEKYKCDKCNQEKLQYEFDVFDGAKKICSGCFDRKDTSEVFSK